MRAVVATLLATSASFGTVPARAQALASLSAEPSSLASMDADSMPGELRYTTVAATTAGLLGLGALVVSLSAKSAFEDLDNRCAPVCSEPEVGALRDRARVADVFWILTAVSAASTVGLYFFETRWRGAARLEASAGGARVRW